MNRKKKQPRLSNALIASIGAALIVVVLFVSFLFSSGLLHGKGAGIRLPEDGEQASGDNTGLTITAQSVYDVAINADNARQVIASIKRPQDYSCRVENKLYYGDQFSALYSMRYVSGDASRTDTLNSDGTVQSALLRAGGQVYAWNMGDSTYYKGAQGDFTDDAAAMLPSYEDVLKPEIKLTDAGKQDVAFEPCVRVSFEQDGYQCTYFISAASGLLKSATFQQGGALKRQVTVSELSTDKPEEALFRLPNGQTVTGEE